MSTTDEVVKILSNALKMTPTARAFIAEQLLDSLNEEPDVAITDEWKAEIARRCTQVDQNQVALIPEEQVFRDAFEALG